MKRHRLILERGLPIWALALCGTAAIACGGDDDGDGDGDGIGSYAVTGTVIDFETGAALDGAATVSTDGLAPPPTVSVNGADFTIEGVPPFSAFHILAGSPPDYRSTYNVTTEVEEADVEGVDISVVSEAYLDSLADGFGIEATSGTSVFLVRVVDEGGAPLAGLPAAAFEVGSGVVGPLFLDADRLPDPEAGETSSSGYVVLFDVPEGLYSLAAAGGSGYTMAMPDSPSAATAITLAQVSVSDGETPELPTGVSFAADVAPIFEARGCVNCHDGGGIGKDLGGLHLNGASEKMHRELTEETSAKHGTPRVDTDTPEASLVLTMPSREDPPDDHPNVTFTSSDDPDYRIILGWITEGALLD